MGLKVTVLVKSTEEGRNTRTRAADAISRMPLALVRCDEENCRHKHHNDSKQQFL